MRTTEGGDRSVTTNVASYVHGYDDRERERLSDQAHTLAELLHAGTRYGKAERVLEVGCGVGAQTRILARRSPEASFTCVDHCASSIELAQKDVAALGIENVRFEVRDLHRLPYPDGSFDHVFVCFVLEHLGRPIEALRGLRRLLVEGGSITVIEGDHGTAVYHPRSNDAQHTIDCLVRAQYRASGGDARIGRRLSPILVEAGFDDVRVMPCPVYADSSRPEWVEGFTRNTFIAMVRGARDLCLHLGLTDPERWSRGIGELERTAQAGGTFSYMFYKAVGTQHAGGTCRGTCSRES